MFLFQKFTLASNNRFLIACQKSIRILYISPFVPAQVTDIKPLSLHMCHIAWLGVLYRQFNIYARWNRNFHCAGRYLRTAMGGTKRLLCPTVTAIFALGSSVAGSSSRYPR